MKAVSYKEYVAGWLDSSVHDFLQSLKEGATTRFALIACLDSDANPAALLERSPELAPLAAAAQVLGNGLLLPTQRLLEADSAARIFFGFDELWFFPNDEIEPQSAPGRLVGPSRIDQAKLDQLGAWMTKSSCSMGLGDGVGLNILVKARGLLRPLIAHSLEQPAAQSAFAAA